MRSLKRWLSYKLRLWKRRLHIPIKLVGNIKINAHRIESQWIVNSLLHGYYEGSEARSLHELIRPNDRVLELGTGLAYISCLAAKYAHTGRVLSYEANPEMVALANETIQLNAMENVKVRNGIMGIETGHVQFYVSKHFWESSTEPRLDSTIISVPVESMSMVQESFNPNVLIVDIEGGEYELFKTPFWNSHAGLKTMSIEFHKCANPFERFSALNFDGWEPNIPLRQVQESLLHNHQTVTFVRI